jgi:glycosyltransferase involved in cell wall biosynthesis
MRISVVIPAYRAAGTVARAVDSVLRQTMAAQEILVVDDGSPDDIAGTLADYGNSVRVIRKPNGGAASARNRGIDDSRGELIAFLDADDYWEPQKLQRQADLFRQRPLLGLVSSMSYSQEPGCQRFASELAPQWMLDRPLRAAGERVFELATRVWTTTVMVRRSALNGHRFVSGLEPAEDRDLWARIVSEHEVWISSERLATAVLEPGSLSRNNLDRDCRNMLAVVHRNANLLGARGLRRWETKTYRRWAGMYLASGNARAALAPAWQRLRGDLASAEAWWVLFKAVAGCARSGVSSSSW